MVQVHLYASFGCPWATRVLIARKLKRLEEAISLSIAEPVMDDEGWRFGDYPGATNDPVNQATHLHEIYTRADPHFTGRATVPALWDKERRTIVNNESADLLRIFNSGFGALADETVDLYPKDLRAEVDALAQQQDVILAAVDRAVAALKANQQALLIDLWKLFDRATMLPPEKPEPPQRH